jgi:hypothetical protein
MLIYRPRKRIVERFDPNGNPTAKSYDYMFNLEQIDRDLKTLFTVTLAPLLKTYTPEYHTPETFVFDDPRFVRFGFQKIEVFLEKDEEARKAKKEQGYCILWVFFVMETILLNPGRDTKDIILSCLKIGKSEPLLFRQLIRGYLKVLSQNVGKVFQGLPTAVGARVGKDEHELYSKESYMHRTMLRSLQQRAGTKKTRHVVSTIAVKQHDDRAIEAAAPAEVYGKDKKPKEIDLYYTFLNEKYKVENPSGQATNKMLQETIQSLKKSWDSINAEIFVWYFENNQQLNLYIYFLVNNRYPCPFFEKMLLGKIFAVHNLDRIVLKARRRYVDLYLFLRVFHYNKRHYTLTCSDKDKVASVHDIAIDMYNRFQLLVYYYILEHQSLFCGLESEEDKKLGYGEILDIVNSYLHKNIILMNEIVFYFYTLKFLNKMDYYRNKYHLCKSKRKNFDIETDADLTE